MNRCQAKIRELCSVDIRSLALFRMGLALILLWDIATRFPDLAAHYSDWGVLPRDVLIAKFINVAHLSIYLINGSWAFTFVCFAAAALFAMALLIGYKTRLATVASWIFLISLHSRNPLILQGGDMFLRLLLFWAMFLPLGACWSIDKLLDRQKKNTGKSVLLSCIDRSPPANRLHLLVLILVEDRCGMAHRRNCRLVRPQPRTVFHLFWAHAAGIPFDPDISDFCNLILGSLRPLVCFLTYFHGPTTIGDSDYFYVFPSRGIEPHHGFRTLRLRLRCCLDRLYSRLVLEQNDKYG